MSEDLAAALHRFIEANPGVTAIETPVGELQIIQSDHAAPANRLVLNPSMCVVAQGEKWATFGENRLVYKAGEALVVGIATPSTGRVSKAVPDKPCLAIAFELDLSIMRDVAQKLTPLPPISRQKLSSVFVTDYQGPLGNCALRIVQLLDNPAALSVLYPMIISEICYWLLTGPHGPDILDICLPERPSRRIANAAQSMREHYDETLRIEELASRASMSPSAFHRQFKALTSLTPLQYQKQIRLIEARRLIMSNGLNIESAAFKVGYESASQFSREYSKMFGVAPKRHIKSLWSDVARGSADA